MLLAHVLDCDRMRLYMEADRPASAQEREALRQQVARAARHEPVQYLLGEAWFFGQPFAVTPDVLIPRPSTETLVEHVLQWLRRREMSAPPLIADIGTGSGCIAISIAQNHPEARLVATDISDEALALASENAQRHGVASRIEFRSGSLLDPLRQGSDSYDVICSNPPYIPDHEWPDVGPNVKDYEPHTALRAGGDGLDFIRPILAQSGDLLADSGQLVVEFADCQHETIAALARDVGRYQDIMILNDQEGLHRVLVAG